MFFQILLFTLKLVSHFSESEHNESTQLDSPPSKRSKIQNESPEVEEKPHENPGVEVESAEEQPHETPKMETESEEFEEENQKKVRCQFCSDRFHKDSYKRHAKTCHLYQKLIINGTVCKCCSRNFDTRKVLYSHIRHNHAEEFIEIRDG